jgi:hypothetical protein
LRIEIEAIDGSHIRWSSRNSRKLSKRVKNLSGSTLTLNFLKKFIFTNNNIDLKKWNKKKIQNNEVKRKISNFGL